MYEERLLFAWLTIIIVLIITIVIINTKLNIKKIICVKAEKKYRLQNIIPYIKKKYKR